MEIKEFEIPVPWGHIAVKAWGAENNTPILMVHGFRDNAGTFDRLIPYLPRKFYYICVDLPGHGKSTHFPPHVLVHMLNYVLCYKIIMDYLNRKKYIIIGHSWGGQMGLLFTQLYPDYVTKLIILDGVHLYPISTKYFKQYLRMRLDQIMEINKKLSTRKPPLYTYEEAVKRLVQNRMYGELTKEAADAILKRSLTEVEKGKFSFTGDIRIQIAMGVYYGHEFLTNLAKKYSITCPVLFIMASNSIPMVQYFKGCIQEIQKSNKCFIRKVEGDHNVHTNQPEIVAPIINSFLSYRNKL